MASITGGSTLWYPLKTQLNYLGGYIFTYIFMVALYYGELCGLAWPLIIAKVFFNRQRMEGEGLPIHVSSSVL
jgi:hypothetical protein